MVILLRKKKKNKQIEKSMTSQEFTALEKSNHVMSVVNIKSQLLFN